MRRVCMCNWMLDPTGTVVVLHVLLIKSQLYNPFSLMKKKVLS